MLMLEVWVVPGEQGRLPEQHAQRPRGGGTACDTLEGQQDGSVDAGKDFSVGARA